MKAILNSTLFVFFVVQVTLLSPLVHAEQEKQSRETVRWPLPPAKTRFVYVKSLYGEPQRQKRGFFAKLKKFFAGESRYNYFTRPHDIAVSAKGWMVVTDPGAAGVHILNTNNNEYHFIQEFDDTRLRSPIGVAISAEDEILISDSILKTILRFSPDGELLGKISDETFSRPTDIAIHPQTNDIYVLDTLGHTIHIYDHEGNKLKQFGKRGNQSGEFNYPTHLAFSHTGLLYVTDTMNFRIQVFDQQLKARAQFGKLGNRLGEFSKAKGIALDREDNIYITDSHFDHLLIYDSAGRFLLPIGGNGTGPGLFNLPSGVAISREFIYIVDSYNRRIQVLKRVG